MPSEQTQTAKLTKTFIEKLTYQKEKGQRDIWWDSGLPGFGVRVYPSGKKSFVIEYRVNRRKRLKVIAPAGTELVTLTQAKEQARKDLLLLLDGKDPLSARDQLRQSVAFTALADVYIERYAKPHKKTWQEEQRKLKCHLLPHFGSRPVCSISHDDVSGFHSDFGAKHPYEANRLASLLSGMFNKAIQWGMVPDNFKNPCIGIDYFKEHKRDRFITHEELPRLIEAIEAEGNIYMRSALWLYLLTGVRKSELLTCKWENIDLSRNELKLPDTKAGRAHYIPLTQPAMEIINKLPKLEGNPYLFPSAKPGKHLVNIDKPWRRVRDRAGIPDVRLHDLRRTLGSWLAQSGNSLHLIGRVLNHSNTSTTEVYARFGQDNVRTALEQYTDQLMGIAGKKPAADVVDIKKPGKSA